MDPNEVISFSDAASEIGCSRSTLYRAADDGRLNDVEIAGRKVILMDEAWENFEPKLIGGRARKMENQDQDAEK